MWVGAARPLTEAPNVLLMFHGLGDTSPSFSGLATKMALPWTQAGAVSAIFPLPFDMDGAMWYPSFEEDGSEIAGYPGERRRTSGLTNSRKRVHTIIQSCIADGGFQAKSIFLLGFAQGGVVALDAALSWPGNQLGGVMAMSSELFLPETCPRNDVAAMAKTVRWAQDATPVFVASGTADPGLNATQQRLEGLRAWMCAGTMETQSYDRPFGMLASAEETRHLYEFLAPKLTVPEAPEAYSQLQGNADFLDVTGRMEVPAELREMLRAGRQRDT